MAKTEKKSPGQLVDEIFQAVTRSVHVETSDGTIREGRCSGIGGRVLKLNGVKVDLPYDLELNGDPQDRIELARISKLDVF